MMDIFSLSLFVFLSLCLISFSLSLSFLRNEQEKGSTCSRGKLTFLWALTQIVCNSRCDLSAGSPICHYHCFPADVSQRPRGWCLCLCHRLQRQEQRMNIRSTWHSSFMVLRHAEEWIVEECLDMHPMLKQRIACFVLSESTVNAAKLLKQTLYMLLLQSI